MAKDLAVAESDLALGEGCHFRIMRDHDDGVSGCVEFAEDVDYDLLICGVEVAGRLVGEQDRRVVDESAGDADALLLSAAEFARQVIGARAKAYALKRSPGVGGVRHGVEILSEHDVFERGQVGDQMKLLEDETDLVGAKAVEFGRAHRMNFFGINGEFAGGGCVQAAEEVDQGRFAGA